MRSEYEYKVARKVIQKLKPLLNDKYVGQVDEASYMRLWDTVFEIIDTCKEIDTYDETLYCCMR